MRLTTGGRTRRRPRGGRPRRCWCQASAEIQEAAFVRGVVSSLRGAHAMAISQSAIDDPHAGRSRYAPGARLFWSQRCPIVSEKLPLRLVGRTDHSCAVLIDVLKLVSDLKDAASEKRVGRMVNEIPPDGDDSRCCRPGSRAGCSQAAHAFRIDDGGNFRGFCRIVSSQNAPDCPDGAAVDTKLWILGCRDDPPRRGIQRICA